MKNKISILFSLRTPIVSVNNMYGTKVMYSGTRPYASMYRSATSKKMEAEVREQLKSVKFTEEQLDFLRNTEFFDLTFAFILRKGKKRDTSNMSKLAEDCWTRYVHDDLGIDTYDDCKHARVILSKSYLPNSEHEYILMEISQSNHNMRYDLTPKPGKIHFETDRKTEIPPLPKRKKKGVNYVEEVSDKSSADCFVYCLSAEDSITPDLIMNLTNDICRVRYNGCGFVYLAFLGSDSDWREHPCRPTLSSISEMIYELGPSGRVGFIGDTKELEEWWK